MSGMVIVGAGQAGLQAAEALRAEGWAGEITLLGDETHAPYHRPPLSKEALAEGVAAYAPRLFMRSPEALARKSISLRTGVTVAAIDRAAQEVVLHGGERLGYQGLCLALGARNRPLPFGEAANVLGLRTLHDATLLDAELAKARHVVIIGGGFIGLEVAASARKQGKTVTVVEVAPRLMARVVAPVISETYARLHETHGTALVLGVGVAGLEIADGRATAVLLADGRALAADLVVYGIGILPNAELAAQAGLAVEAGGIVVDGCARTQDRLITAAGDCTAARLGEGLPVRRLESVQNAVEQGKSAAAALLGRERAFTATPWFWSNQYAVGLQIAGLSGGFDEVVTRGDVPGFAFTAFYFKANTLIAADSLNQPKDHMALRRILDQKLGLTPAQAADASFDLTRHK